AADGRRLLGDRQRRQHRPSPRRDGGHPAGRTHPPEDQPGAAAARRYQARVPERHPPGDPRGRPEPGRDLLPGVRQLSGPGGREDRNRGPLPVRLPGPGGRPVLVRPARAVPEPEGGHRGDDRARRLRRPGRRPGRRTDPERLLLLPRSEDPRDPTDAGLGRRRRQLPLMEAETLPRRFARSRERPSPFERIGLLSLDPLLVLGALGLAGAGLYTLGATTQHAVAGQPYYCVLRQAIYAGIGIALLLAIARVDYSRLRELRVGLYTVMIVSIVAVLMLGSATRGSKRWIDLPFFTFQPSELGKILLVCALAGFAIDRGRHLSARQRTARLMAMGFLPAAIVFMQPDIGTAGVYIAITLAVLFIAGVRWTHFAFLGGLIVAAVAVVLVLAPAVGHPVLQGYQEQRLTS